MKTIPLSQGYVALVDDADFERVSQYKWSAMVQAHTVYAIRMIPNGGGKLKAQLLHRFILDATDPAVEVDHENHNGLDCQQHNLRPCRKTQNNANRKKLAGCSSRYKGVSWHCRAKKWYARIGNKHLGVYESEREAALIYDRAARNRFGNFAYTNF